MSSSSRSDRLASLFDRVRKLPANERDAFLDRECGDDADLRAELDSLLVHRDEQGDFLAGPTGDIPTVTADRGPSLELEPGTVIGPYRLTERIGDGGFGVVYRAQQTSPVRREVALKIIKLGMDTAQVLARFEAERQALAVMSHPNVATVLDAGATDTGRPYFVMEYVPGDPITDYCDRHRLNTVERLELFIQACNAIQHAHQKGIIHRDIKPSNILVAVREGRAVVKVIDFGVAKATQQRLTEKTVFTELGQLIGTPAYMSPEQAEMGSLDIDTRSDVYSLGVLLFELLTGSLPFDPTSLRGAGFAEIQRIIREVEPPKPSTKLSGLGDASTDVARMHRCDARSLLREVRGDLDWVVMRCLEKDRTRRYETANGLAQDIRRHLKHEPVVAGPPSAAYRLRKFVRRNRGAVTGTAVFGALVIAATVSVSVLYARTRAAEQNARERLDQVRTLTMTFVHDLPLGLQEVSGGTALREYFVEAALPYLEQLAEDSTGADAEALLNLGIGYKELAKVLGYTDGANLGRFGEAEQHYKTCIAILERATRADPENTDALVHLMEAHSGLAAVCRALTDHETARHHFRLAIAIGADVLVTDPSNEPARNELAYALWSLGDLAPDRNAMRRRYEEALETLTAHPNVGTTRLRRTTAAAYSRLGNVAAHADGAADLQERALEIFRQVAAENPEIAEFREDIAISLRKLAQLRVRQGRTEAALAHLVEATSILRSLFDADPVNHRVGGQLITTYQQHAEAIRRVRGELTEALALLELADRICRQGLTRDPLNVSLLELRANLLSTRASLLADRSQPSMLRWDDAAGGYRESLALYDRLEELDAQALSHRYRRSFAQIGLAGVLMETGELDEADESLRGAEDALRELVTNDPESQEYLRRLGLILDQRGDLALRRLDTGLATQLITEAAELAEEVADLFPNESVCHRDAAQAQWKLGTLYTNIAMNSDPSMPTAEAWQRALDAFQGSRSTLVQMQDTGMLESADAPLIELLEGRIEEVERELASLSSP